MHIDGLKLINYRNYNDLLVDFNKNINLIVGKNGQGKTNIVESLSLMALGRSFRTSKDKELIKFGEENLYCACRFRKSNIEKKIEVVVTKDKKGIKVNGFSINSIHELLGNLNIVVFSPEDLKLVKDGPKEKRGFIDKEISQIKPRYYNLLTRYNKSINQRNTLLKSHYVDKNLLSVYDESLAEYGSEIYLIRKHFIENISEIADSLHKKLTDGVEELKISYKNQIGEIGDDREVLKKNIVDRLSENRDSDIFNKNTRFGPHRDDLSILINGVDVRIYGSQGQQKTASISLKLSEIELIKKEIGEYPVLILDDVFSELDQNRQRLIVERLEDIQMFITSADPLHKNILKNSNYTLFNIEAGNVKSIENGGR